MGFNGGPIPFCLDNKWLKIDSFKIMVNDVWNEPVEDGTASFRLFRKLFRLKQEIKKWTKDVGKKEENRINELMQEMDTLDSFESKSMLTADLNEKRNNLRLELANRLHMEGISWKQKVKEKWIKDGDKNTKYFHSLASHRRMTNYVEKITVNGNQISGNVAMREAAKNHFSQLYQEKFVKRPLIDNIQFNKIEESDRLLLEAEFSEDEITYCLKDCDGDKAPGPDGFNFKFLQDF